MHPTHRHNSANHTTLAALLLLSSLFFTACDGFNVYQCNGKLLDAQTRNPAPAVRVLISPGSSPSPSPSSSPDWSRATLTAPDGTFYADLLTTSGWLFALRPPPPKLQHLQLAYKTLTSTGTITFDLTPNMQSKHPHPNTRIIDIPPATIPSSKP